MKIPKLPPGYRHLDAGERILDTDLIATTPVATVWATREASGYTTRTGERYSGVNGGFHCPTIRRIDGWVDVGRVNAAVSDAADALKSLRTRLIALGAPMRCVTFSGNRFRITYKKKKQKGTK